jgi:hypothetical protein
MRIFNSAQANTRSFILKKWLVNSFVFLVGISVLLFTGLIRINTSWFLAIAMLVADLVSQFSKNRIKQIGIDENNRKVVIRYYNMDEGHVTTTHSFDRLQVRIREPISWLGKSTISIEILAPKKHYFKISHQKDGFTDDSLENLKMELETLTSPSTKAKIF